MPLQESPPLVDGGSAGCPILAVPVELGNSKAIGSLILALCPGALKEIYCCGLQMTWKYKSYRNIINSVLGRGVRQGMVPSLYA